MSGIIAIALVAVIALFVVGMVAHFLFSPWLLVAIAILAWIKFGPRRTRQ